MKLKSLFYYILFLAVIWSGICVAKPFWDRYEIGQEMEMAAVYGTKHEVDAVKKLLRQKSLEHGWPFTEKDFKVEKDSSQDVTITLSYEDEIKIFGIVVKSLEITIVKEASFIKPFV